MNKFWIIASHTYVTRLKTKMFYISTILILLFIVIFLNFDSIMQSFSGEDDRTVAVIDESGELLSPLKANIQMVELDWKIEAFSQSVEEGKTAVLNGEFAALITLMLNEEGLPEATFYAENITDSELQSEITQQLQQLKVTRATEQLGIDPAEIATILSPITLQKVALDENSKSEEELNQATWIVYIMLTLLYFAVMMYGTIIATDVATEKSSRVMELLVSSVSPIIHMFAKIVGIALLGLTQIGLLIAVGFAMLQIQPDDTGGIIESVGLQDAPISLLIYGLLFFILGYFLYATLAAMLGSLVSRVDEVQQIITPMMLLIIAAFMIAIFGIRAPESTVVTVTSYIPFFAPMLMFIRVGLLDVALWEVILSIGLLVVTIIILAIIAARVYKGGVLLYGKTSSLKDIKKAIQLTRKE